MDNNEFYYYLHKTKISDPEMIESIFNDGLKSKYHFSIHSTLMPFSESDLINNGIENTVIGYLGQSEEYNSVVVVKIPKRYFSDRIHRDGKIDPAVPMFREYSEVGWNWNALFTPKLIQGIYCRDLNKSFVNPNFCPVFDPSGCQFSDEQIRNFDSFNRIEWKNLATNRRKYTFQQLYAGDRASHAWDAIVSHYSQLYGIRPKQMVKYIMPEDDKLLFEERKGHHI